MTPLFVEPSNRQSPTAIAIRGGGGLNSIPLPWEVFFQVGVRAGRGKVGRLMSHGRCWHHWGTSQYSSSFLSLHQEPWGGFESTRNRGSRDRRVQTFIHMIPQLPPRSRSWAAEPAIYPLPLSKPHCAPR